MRSLGHARWDLDVIGWARWRRFAGT